MVTVTVENVTNVAPELTSETEDRVNLFIEYARGLVDEGTFGSESKARLAISLLAAHYLTTANLGGTGGDVSSESLGDLSVSYSSGGAGAGGEGYASTTYGSMYLTIAGSVGVGPLIV